MDLQLHSHNRLSHHVPNAWKYNWLCEEVLLLHMHYHLNHRGLNAWKYNELWKEALRSMGQTMTRHMSYHNSMKITTWNTYQDFLSFFFRKKTGTICFGNCFFKYIATVLCTEKHFFLYPEKCENWCENKKKCATEKIDTASTVNICISQNGNAMHERAYAYVNMICIWITLRTDVDVQNILTVSIWNFDPE